MKVRILIKIAIILVINFNSLLSINAYSQAVNNDNNNTTNVRPVTAEEALAMVKKGVSYIKANGKEKTFVAINDQDKQFIDRDLYLFANQLDGTVLANGGNKKLVGKNLIDITDSNRIQYMKERMELAKKNTSFWQDYSQLSPFTKKIEAKKVYCERVDDFVLCGGIYKSN